jgi:hypothetical protein
MSTNPEQAWAAYLHWSRHAGWTQERLAEEIMANRANLNQVLTGARPGGPTWRRIVKVLPMDGLMLLQQCSAWNNTAETALAARRDREQLLALGEKCREPVAN